jgi:AraC family transcriptional regulator
MNMNHVMALPELRLRGLTLTIASYAPFQKVSRHSHENAFFCMALSGFCTETYRGRERTYESSVLSFLPADELHSLKFYQAGMHSLGIEVELPFIERLRECSLKVAGSIHCYSGQLALLCKKVYGEFRQADNVAPLVIEGLILEMLAEVARHRERADGGLPHWLKIAKELVHERFSEALTLNDISNAAGVHPVYLSRAFRKHQRCTVGEYIRRLRVEYASRQILSSKATLLEIATSAGFSDQSHFSRVFKRQMGMTPTEYQRIHARR